MKKYLFFASQLLLISFFLSACQQDDSPIISSTNKNLEKVEMQKLLSSKEGILIKTEKKQYKEEDEINLIFKNDLDTSVSYGLEFEVQKLSKGAWVNYPLKNPIFTQELCKLNPHSVESQAILLNDLTEKELTPGKYRIVKKFDDYYLAAPFEMIG